MVFVEEGKKFSVVPDKKLAEVRSWFEEHFKTSDRREYSSRSPFVVLSGPTGCGKTSTLERIAEELRLSIKEFSETTDTSLIQTEIRDVPCERDDSNNTTLWIDKRKSLVFEGFVINNVRYETLYANRPKDEVEDEDDAAAEFDDDDDFVIPPMLSQVRPKPPPSGVIIHIETPLPFARSTPILIQCLRRLKKIIKEVSLTTPRRVAIVFEATEDNDPIMSLSSNVRQSLDLQIFRINPVTRLNMKKFIEFELKNYNYRLPEKVILDQLIDDCNGDVSACKSTLHLLCQHGHSSNLNGTVGINNFSSTPIQYSKRQKIDYDPMIRLNLNPKLLRDVSKSSCFFHTLGKIFYQKRLYPDPKTNPLQPRRQPRSIDRPYEAQNSTEYLADQVDSETRKLNAWLHQNYPKYCGPNDIEKAAMFLENLSLTDTLSLDSTQSSQYYESHKFIDLIQKHVAIESTIFSLYKDQSGNKKSTDKKAKNKNGWDMIIKTSVEYNFQFKEIDSYHCGFAKPTSLIISKLSDDHQALLERFSSKMTQISGKTYERSDLLLDYAPYVRILLDSFAFASDQRSKSVSRSSQTPVWAKPRDSNILTGQEHLRTIVGVIQKFDDPSEIDYDQRHETLLELIDHCDSQKIKEEPGDATMTDSIDSGLTIRDAPMYD